MEISHISDLNAYSSLGSEGIVSKIPLIHKKKFAFHSWEKDLTWTFPERALKDLQHAQNLFAHKLFFNVVWLIYLYVCILAYCLFTVDFIQSFFHKYKNIVYYHMFWFVDGYLFFSSKSLSSR